MKTCKDCKIEKEDADYYGVQNECKECTKKRVKENSKRVGTKYDFSEKGVFRVIYKTQKRNQKLRGHGDMPYSKVELIEWCKKNNFDQLFSAWRDSGNLISLKPSVDRLDDFKGYSFDNIRLGTWKENKKHQSEDRMNGVGTNGVYCKKVTKFDSERNVICEYVSYWSAVRDCGYAIEYQLKKGIKCRNGFYWSY